MGYPRILNTVQRQNIEKSVLPENKDFKNLRIPPNRTSPLFLRNITFVPLWHYDLIQNNRNKIITANGILGFIIVVLCNNIKTRKTATLCI